MDVIRFSPPLNGGTINLTGFDLPITDGVWIVGPGSGLLTIDAKSLYRVFSVSGGIGKQVWISGLNLINGKANNTGDNYGGGIWSNTPLTLQDIVISACRRSIGIWGRRLLHGQLDG